MTIIEKKLAALKAEELKLRGALEVERANKQFRCLCCGGMHKIKSCAVIQTHWYTPPSGCTDGDYWNTGELQIICPTTDHKNRILWDTESHVDYFMRRDYEYNAEKQFSCLYRHLFKEVIDDYKQDKRRWVNNTYIDEHHAKFGLRIKGFDYSKQVKHLTPSRIKALMAGSRMS